MVEAGAQGPRQVLLVDDDAETLASLGQALRLLGRLDVVTADSGTKALALLHDTHPDALVTDYRMPGMDGLQLASAARKRFPRLPIVMITAFNDAALRDEAQRAGCCDIMGKPLDVTDLLDAVRQCYNKQYSLGGAS